ncbi:DUF6843 domain-containing protein [Psychrobacillus sp. NPDC096623]|uniref:DUF6843 domain-containing protein n=1 Tax=Psychrobacillus sp. NPDC096623 TaxID=3364492 RepID=UPI0038236965
MGKKIWLLISFVLTVLLVWWICKPSNDTTVVYHLPEGFKGCFNIYFNQPKEKELEIIDDILLLAVPENGSLLTSSPYKLVTDLGWHKEKAFYIDKDGKPVSEINMMDSNIGHTFNGNRLSERIMGTFDPNQEQCY